MKIFKSTYTGIKLGASFWKISSIITLLQVLLTSLVGAAVWSWMGDTIGHSVGFNDLIKGYNHDVIQDLINHQSAGYNVVLKISLWILFLYILVSPFISAGTISCIIEGKDDIKLFLAKGSSYYFKFLSLSLLFLIIHLVFIALFGVLGSMILQSGLESYATEVPALRMIFGLIIIYAIIVIMLVSSSLIAKRELLVNGSGLFRAVGSGFKFAIQHFFYILGIGIIFLLISSIFAYGLNAVVNSVVENGFVMVMVALILQILIIWVRNLIRIMYQVTLVLNPFK